MAIHFGHNPNVVGWQLDNEYAAPSFDPSAKQQFHEWLQKKYGTIARLNQHWATAYWSQTYDNFDEIPVREDGENPALLLEWKRFVSDTWKSYSENQISAIRSHADSRQFITTNTMGWFDGFDEYTVHSVLDIAAWDDYIPTDNYDYIANGAAHDLTRGYKQKNFWVMETEPAFVNWRKTNTPLVEGSGTRHGLAGHRARRRNRRVLGNGAALQTGRRSITASSSGPMAHLFLSTTKSRRPARNSRRPAPPLQVLHPMRRSPSSTTIPAAGPSISSVTPPTSSPSAKCLLFTALCVSNPRPSI